MDNANSVTRKMSSQKLPDGTEIVLHSYGLADWSALQEAALSHYKRTLIKTVTDTLDLLESAEMRREQLKQVYDEAKKLTISDIPSRIIKMPRPDENGNELRDTNGKIELFDTEVDYMSWWMSETVDGKLQSIWLSARKEPSQQNWSKAYVGELFARATENQDEISALEIEQAAQTVGRISQPELAENFTVPSPRTSEGQPTMTVR